MKLNGKETMYFGHFQLDIYLVLLNVKVINENSSIVLIPLYKLNLSSTYRMHWTIKTFYAVVPVSLYCPVFGIIMWLCNKIVPIYSNSN